MAVFNNILAGAAGSGGAAAGYEIERSLRFNSADSAYLDRTPSSAGNLKTWTLSLWVKRCKLGALQSFTSSGNNSILLFDANDKLSFYQDAYVRVTEQVFRDCSAWYHIVLAVDTPNATIQDRARIYVNGSEVTSWAASQTITQNLDTNWNGVFAHNINANNVSQFGDLYIADVYSIDGQALAPTDFGKFDNNNVWQPIEYAGTYGTNGFHLDFSDSSSSAALGTDSSGNSNDWTVNNLVPGNAEYTTSSITSVGTSGSNILLTFTDSTGFAGFNPSDEVKAAVYQSVSGTTVPYTGSSNSSILLDDTQAPYTGTDLTTSQNYLGSNGDANPSPLIVFDPPITSGTGNIYLNCFLQPNAGTITANVGESTETTMSITKNSTWGYYSTGSSTLYNFRFDGRDATFALLAGVQFVTTTSNASGRVDDGLVSAAANIVSIDSGNSQWVVDGGSWSQGETVTKAAVIGDSLIDTPTNYTAGSGNNGGNYCTWNPLAVTTSYQASSLTNGNLDAYVTGNSRNAYSTIAFPSSGKYFFEVTLDSSFSGSPIVGVSAFTGTSNAYPSYVTTPSVVYNWDGTKTVDGSTTSYGATYGAGDVIGVAVDIDSSTVTFYKNGSSQGSISLNVAGAMPHVGSAGATGTYSLNAGQRPFVYTPPTGYLSLCTTNLPDPTIADGSTAFDVNVWDGDGTTNRLISTNFSPDFTWMKIISQSGQWHLLADSVRGGDKTLSTNNTNAEVTRSGFVSFDSTGFTIGDGNSNPSGGQTLVGFAWDAGSSTVTNTDGSITSSVRANPSAGFSIVSYTGNGTIGATVGHGLGANVALYFLKNRSNAADWPVLGHALNDAFGGSNKYLLLNSTAAAGNAGQGPGNSSTIELYDDATNNTNGDTYIAYCFAPVEGYSAFGSYTGNGSNDGAFVYTGFAVRYLLTKPSSSTGDWLIWDTERDPINPNDKTLGADNTSGENSNGYDVDLLSNGFKWRQYGSSANGSNVTYIYAAFAEHPFKTARAR